MVTREQGTRRVNPVLLLQRDMKLFSFSRPVVVWGQEFISNVTQPLYQYTTWRAEMAIPVPLEEWHR
ncbi:hypothetical protein PISMIDRAFT_676137, partial [Pisolithus microcarpus 441]